MKHLKNSILLVVVLLFSLSCHKKEEEKPDSKGSIFVTVIYGYENISGAQISTEPTTSIVNSDITGSAIITDVPIGGYKVNAFHSDIGSGSAPVTVKENEVTNVNVYLISGVFENPIVKIQQPLNNSVHNIGSEINFVASISDDQDSPATLSVEWSSDLDGVLNTDPINSDGFATFSTSSLSEGKHTIVLKVTDSDDLVTKDEISITVKKLPNPVVLDTIKITNNGLNLTWTAFTEPDFLSYRIMRSEIYSGPYEVVGVISDRDSVNFSDPNVTYGTTYNYQIALVLTNGDVSFSNIESKLFEGENIYLGVNIVRMILDPVRPYIYALDKINNSLLFINKETKTVEKTIFVGSEPTDIDINLDNTKAYVTNFGSTIISVIDLESQEKIKDLFVDTQSSWDGNPYRLVCVADNRIVFTSEDQWNNIRLISAENGFTYSNAGSVYYPGLLTNTSGTIVYVTESGSTGSSVIRYNITSDNELVDVDKSTEGYSSGLRDACISGNDLYIFYRKIKYLANNLHSELGSFTENIVDCNYDGSIAIGVEHIWDAETFSIIRTLPLSSSISRLDKDGNTLYIYSNSSSKIYIITIN